jgi:hypothetical protein
MLRGRRDMVRLKAFRYGISLNRFRVYNLTPMLFAVT